MNISEKKTNHPLVERILIIGVSQEDVISQLSGKTKGVPILDTIKSLKIKILEEYKSNELRESPKENYKENIPTFCMPEGPKLSDNPSSHTIHSFSLITSTAKRKHCSCLSYYETYETKEKSGKIYILKAVCIVSSKAVYDTHKELLTNLHSIQVNHKDNRSNNSEQLNYIYLRDKSKSYTVLKEYSILEFYFAFILNTLKYPQEETSFFVNYIGNNIGKKCFLKYFVNSKQNFPLADFEMTKLLDYFNVEDLIKVYMALLMEYKLILIFDDYQTINLLIFSITNLLFPLKWKFPIISFIAPSLIDTIEAPFGIIIGLHSQYMNILNDKINHDLMIDETIIYNLQNKNFVFFPKKFPELPLKILNELRSSIYMVLSEKLSLTSEIDNEETELNKIFPTKGYKKIDPMIYLNLKINQIFFNVFLELIKNLESSIYFNKVKSIKSTNDRVPVHEIFDSTKFAKDRDFHNDKKYFTFIEQFSKTIMFMDFVDEYIRKCDKHPRYKNIKKILTTLNTKENGKIILKEMNREYIKQKILAYYNFKYLSLEEALKIFPDYFNVNNKKQTTSSNFIWSPLESKKITNFLLHYERIIINESDEKIKENTFRKLYLELARFKDVRIYDHMLDEDIVVDNLNRLNVRETKTKSHLESLNKGNYILYPKLHKQSTSLNMESELNTSLLSRIINKSDNKIENYYFNNINISSDQFSKRTGMNIRMSIDNNNKLLNSHAQNPSEFTIAHSINSLRNISSMGNTLTSSANINNNYSGINPFTTDIPQFTINNNISNNDNVYSKIKKRSAQLNKVDSINKKKDSLTTGNKVGEILKGLKVVPKNKYTENELQRSNKKDKSIKITETNFNQCISPLKQPKSYGTNHLHKPSLNIRVGGVIDKLAGDDEVELFFSGNEEDN